MNQTLAKERYLVLHKFIEPGRAQALAGNFVKHCEENNVEGDTMVPNSASFYNYLPFVDLMCEKTNEISDLLGERVFPSYSYSRVYKNSNTLKPHMDRDESEIALTVCLDYDKEWPIWFYKKDGTKASITLEPGDAIIYFGKELIHWREEFHGDFSNNAFLFYVRADGPYANNFFDNKRSGFSQYAGEGEDNRKTKKLLFAKNKKSVKSRAEVERPKIDSFSRLFPGSVDASLCEKILAEYSNCEQWVNDPYLDTVGEKIEILPLSKNLLTQNNQYLRYELDAQVHVAISSVLARYSKEVIPVKYTADTGYTLIKINEGGNLKSSQISYPGEVQQPFLKVIVFLKDSGFGGEICLFDSLNPIPVKMGDALVIPDNFLFPFGVSPVIKDSFPFLITWIK